MVQNAITFCGLLLLRFNLFVVSPNKPSMGLHMLQSLLLLLVVSSTWSHTPQFVHLCLPLQDLFCHFNKVSSHLHLANNGDGASELLVNHEAKDAHHGSTALVELLSTEINLLLLSGVSKEANREASSGAEVTGEGSLVLAPDGELKEANEEEDLRDALDGDLLKGSKAGRDVLKTEVLDLGEVAGKTDSSGSPEVAEEGELGDTAVLELNVPEAVETLLVGILQEHERIVEAKGRLDAELSLEGIQSGGGLGRLLGGESGGRAEEGKGGENLHRDFQSA
mmetsp:Transcript_11053/g.23214  ORF Transcript_11053/g.23214 Transcript_11053/m.23214 type:complete len:280 (-) Transcript_11053:88-927(-)